jgi:predicted RNase H-like HicB family nuclease
MVITGRIWEEDGSWFAATDKLPIAGFGQTPTEATARANEALAGYLNYLEKIGELSQALEHYGVIKTSKRRARYGFSMEVPGE